MKHYGASKRVRPLAALLPSIFTAFTAAFLLPGPIIANSIIAGGFVPVLHTVSITPATGDSPIRTDGSVEVAILEIDNNMQEYGLVLDFAGRSGNLPDISEVRLEALEGILGTGLDASPSTVLRPGPVAGRFLWNPGIQSTATLGYRIKVVVAYGSLPADPPLMLVGMPASY